MERNNRLSVEDDNNLSDYNKFLENNTNRVKNIQLNQITELGDILLSEIEEKKTKKSREIVPKINYILDKSKRYSRQYLLDLDFNDVNDIYNEIKFNNRSVWVRFLELFF